MVDEIHFLKFPRKLSSPCFIIAEAGVNHNGNIDLAHKLIDAAIQARADAVKFQTFKAEKLASKDAPSAQYQIDNMGPQLSQFEMLKRLELPISAYPDLISHCHQGGIVFMSSPFDEDSADFLAGLGMPVFKIPSGEITNLPYLAHIASKQKPMIVSTGMSNLGEVQTAVETIEGAGNSDIVLLHCVSNYPANPADVNLRAMHTLQAAFGVPVGFSDHTLGIEIPIAAAALGACVIEKHFTLDCSMEGPDHKASLNPGGLAAMVAGIHKVEAALGTGRKIPTINEKSTAIAARKSLIAACDIPAGTEFTQAMLAARRPGTGLPPSMHALILGRKARRPIASGAQIDLGMIE